MTMDADSAARIPDLQQRSGGTFIKLSGRRRRVGRGSDNRQYARSRVRDSDLVATARRGAGSQNRAETSNGYVSRFGQSSRGTQQGWQRFGAPGPTNSFMDEGPLNRGERSGWHQFGAPTQQGSGGTAGRQPFSSGGNRFSGYAGPANGSSSSGSYRAPAYHYSAPQQGYRGGGGMSSGGYSHRSTESGHTGGGSSYHGGGGGGSHHGGGGSSHGGGGGGHHGR